MIAVMEEIKKWKCNLCGKTVEGGVKHDDKGNLYAFVKILGELNNTDCKHRETTVIQT